MTDETNQQGVEALSFEEALEELKVIVQRLESGEGKLEEAVEAYQRGAQLKAHCERKLKEAQAKIEKIQLDAQGNPQTSPFDEG